MHEACGLQPLVQLRHPPLERQPTNGLPDMARQPPRLDKLAAVFVLSSAQ